MINIFSPKTTIWTKNLILVKIHPYFLSCPFFCRSPKFQFAYFCLGFFIYHNLRQGLPFVIPLPNCFAASKKNAEIVNNAEAISELMCVHLVLFSVTWKTHRSNCVHTVFIPFSRRQYVCVFILIHFWERFLAENSRCLSVDRRSYRIGMYAVSSVDRAWNGGFFWGGGGSFFLTYARNLDEMQFFPRVSEYFAKRNLQIRRTRRCVCTCLGSWCCGI